MASEQRPIIDTILGDITALVPQFASVVASYRLLVGAAEELRRTQGVCEEIAERAVTRADRAGALIDMFLEILCCKISFSTNFLAVSCAPVDIFRLLSASYSCDPSHLTAEQIIELEALRQALCRERDSSCFYDKATPPCPPQPPQPPAAKPGGQQAQFSSDIAEGITTQVTLDLANIVQPGGAGLSESI